MAVGQRLSKVAKELNVGISTIVEFLHKKGFNIDVNPNTKVSEEMFAILSKEYKLDQTVKKASEELIDRKHKEKKETISIEDVREGQDMSEDEETPFDRPTEKIFQEPRKTVDVKVVGKIDLSPKKPIEKVEKKPETETPPPSKPAAEKPPVKEEPKQPEAPKTEEKPLKKEIEHIPVQAKLEDEIKVVGKIDLDKPKRKRKNR